MRDYADAVTTSSAPTPVRGAGLIVAVQGAAALVIAAVLVVRALAGADQRVVNGLGTAVWFVVVGVGVLAGFTGTFPAVLTFSILLAALCLFSVSRFTRVRVPVRGAR